MPGPIVVVMQWFDVAPLGGGRLRAHDLVDQRRVVLQQLALVEALLADRDVDVRAVVRAVLESFPALASRTALPTSIVTVPVFGFGIFPRGPRMRPSLPTMPIWSGVAMATSKSSKPSSICLPRSAVPTTSAPASCASFALSPSAKTAIGPRPVPCAGASASRAAAARRGGR